MYLCVIQSGVSLSGCLAGYDLNLNQQKGDGFASTLMICADFMQPDLDSSILTRPELRS